MNRVPHFLETYEIPAGREAQLASDGQWHFCEQQEGACHEVTDTETCPGAGGD